MGKIIPRDIDKNIQHSIIYSGSKLGGKNQLLIKSRFSSYRIAYQYNHIIVSKGWIENYYYRQQCKWIYKQYDMKYIRHNITHATVQIGRTKLQ